MRALGPGAQRSRSAHEDGDELGLVEPEQSGNVSQRYAANRLGGIGREPHNVEYVLGLQTTDEHGHTEVCEERQKTS